MNSAEIIESIDAEIARLEEVKKLLGADSTSAPAKAGRIAKKAVSKKSSDKRTISAEGRARIAAAQRARWAKRS